ncbi:PAS [Halanaerobium saccharolyticum subsp. saccharolyticum DSM 6643]|uniref:histidine kinase n=1 Tax=Halanaerobium saccharolyticum subsp. saccharolyticum DSM 6643 TaxID=1293054 RepID=M5E113_9FIRM|nr:ATP-binding protein [Halanaerobium saccharolyticum]CCU79440.1 PAS [Halanaerobium saccharolyticum subsp. saccharolyticum DSM 6643]
MSLKRRLITYIMLIFLLIMLLVGYVLIVQQKDIFQEEIERRGKLLARTLAEISKEALLVHEFSTLSKNVMSFENEQDVVGVKIINNNGRILAALDRNLEGTFNKKNYEQKQNYVDDDKLITIKDIIVDEDVIGRTIITLSQQTLKNKINYSIRMMVVILTSSFLLLTFIIHITSDYYLEPITNLAKIVRKIPESDFKISKLKSKNPPLELKELYNSVIWMYEEMLIIRKSLIEKTQMATLGKMSAYLAHEIRNPLEAISGAVEVIKLKRESDFHNGFFEIINEEIETLNNFLEEFLNFARIKSYEFKKIDIINLLNDISKLLESMIKNNNITLIKEFNSQHRYIKGDINKIKSVFTNIILNSVEAIKKSGYIKIKVEDDEDFILIYIEDNGSGINNKDLDKIFDPFFTTKKSGSGIGLSISKEIIEKHDGKIDAEVENNTIFKIKLPIYKDDSGNEKDINS